MSSPDLFLLPPRDRYNETLVENVHPSAWVNPEPRGRYNLVVVGAGTAGLVTAMGAATLGARVALVERHLMGGDCLNVGCVPSKGLLAAARTLATVRGSADYGVRVSGLEVDFPHVMERMRKLRAGISHHDSARRYRDAGVDVFIGDGQFVDRDQVGVDEKILHFKRAVIATGARATSLPIEGLQEAGYLTNETLFSLTRLPARMAVIGAGPIGCEMAQAFRRFGSQVFLVERLAGILGREDREAAAVVEEAMRKDGVEIVLDCRIQSVQVSNGQKVLSLACPSGARELVVDEILLGVGRTPNLEGLGLREAGVDFEEGKGVLVNDFLQTSNPMIYAAGDICSQFKFTHMADATARIVLQNALFMGRKRVSTLTVPWCTYTDPELAHVGMYESDAAERGLEVTTLVRRLADVDRSILEGDTEGFVKVHIEKSSDRILGATIVGRNAGNLISELTLAISGGLGMATLSNTIHPYPTQAEAIRQVGDAYNRTRLTPFVKTVLRSWLRWTR